MPRTLPYQQREFEMAIAVARWFKLFVARAPIDDWVAYTYRAYKEEARASLTRQISVKDLTDVQKRRLLDRVMKRMGKWWGGAGADLRAAFEELLFNQGGMNANLGGQLALDSLGIGGSFNLTNPALLDNLQHNIMTIRAPGSWEVTRGQITQALIHGAAAGLDMDKTGRLIRQMVGQQWPDLSRGRARVIANTEIARNTSWASQETYRYNGIQEMEWWTALDHHVCHVCADFHGKRVHTSGQWFATSHTIAPRTNPGGMTSPYPPAHPSCRCTLLPVIPSNWAKPITPWQGGERGGKAYDWSMGIHERLESMWGRGGRGVNFRSTSLDTPEQWAQRADPRTATAYAGYKGDIHFSPTYGNHLLRVMLDPTRLAWDRDGVFAFKTLVHEVIHTRNPVKPGEYVVQPGGKFALGAGLEEGLTEALASRFAKDMARAVAQYEGTMASDWPTYVPQVRTVTTMAELAAAAGDLPASGYLAKWKFNTDPVELTRAKQMATDMLRGMGYSSEDIAVIWGRRGYDSIRVALEQTITEIDPFAFRRWLDAHIDDPTLRSWVMKEPQPVDVLVHKAARTVFDVRSLAACDEAALVLEGIIEQLGDDVGAVVQVRAYAEMLARFRLAFKEL